ncbi:unnamed protein product [Mytilus edulis]|uniref:Uncharacterized protein n=1 Tax=Mytilus edulis TaxID=6550 RepID=A0A8S3SUA6_MYTED|nr:unnamed protein product [Mytilus edulis]
MATLQSVGVNMNNWRKPLYIFGPNEQDLQYLILRNEHLQNINPKNFEDHRRTTDEVLKVVMQGIRKFSGEQFEGLVLHDELIKFGSSREGLKVIDALEFDSILIFDINGMIVEPAPGDALGLVRLRVINAEALLERYPWTRKCEVFQKVGMNKYFINSRNLHLKVFESIIDKTRELVNEQLRAGETNFSLRRTAKPPTLDINITLNNERDINDLFNSFSNITLQGQSTRMESRSFNKSLDMDIVPALLLRHDYVPDPNTTNSPNGIRQMVCPVYAVMKWVHTPNSVMTSDKDSLWRVCTSGYERHILDVCQLNPSQQFLMTACRILKTYVSNQDGTNQLHTVAASNHLKTICFHCITLLTIPKEHNSLSGVKEAMGYFLSFLDLCIRSKTLPHFFYGNPWLVLMFPDTSFGQEDDIKNLYGSMSPDTFRQATLSYAKMLLDLKRFYTEIECLDADRIGRFKELLGLQHAYRKPGGVHMF